MGSTAAEDSERKIDISIQTLIQPTIAKDIAVLKLKVVAMWAKELAGYLQEDVLQADKKAVIKLKARAT
jgi:hypothetical protein